MRLTLLLSIFVFISCGGKTTEATEQEVTNNIISDSSEITCPHCGFSKTELLPTEYCLFRYECTNCGKFITPKNGDCCVFCSYGTHECPSIQENNQEE